MKQIGIVTGASSGMGVCFARELVKEQSLDELWIIARRKDNLENVAKNIYAEFGIPGDKNRTTIKVCALDLNGKNGAFGIRDLLADERDFNLSVLVNNAGFGSYGEFASTDTEREMDMIEVNCTSLTGITGYAIPYMSKGSRIIMTASLASFMPLGNFAVYGGTKAYVLSFAVALAAELKHKGITVTNLCPGPVSTEFANVASKGARKEVRHGLSPEKTVAQCLKDSRKGKLYSMYAFKWRFKANASRFISRKLGAWFTYKFNKRPSN